MRKNRLGLSFGFSVFLLAAAGCVSLHAPKGWLPSPSDVQSQAFGGWMELTRATPSGEVVVRGELIAVHPDHVYIMSERVLVDVPTKDVVSASLNIYQNSAKEVGTWAVLGFLSAASHGWVAIISGPIWLLTGIASSNAESKSGLFLYPPTSLGEMGRYARFPQGIPQGLELKLLKPKPQPVQVK